jgi:hypothetical protein
MYTAKSDPKNPNNPKLAQKPITTWRLLVWAYRIQMVQYDTDWCGDNGRDDWLGAPDAFDLALAPTAERSTAAHPDAHIVHARVVKLRWPAGKLIIDSAARRRPPIWNPILPEFRVVPVWIGAEGHIERNSRDLWDVTVYGRLRMMYGVTRKGRKSHEPNGCAIDYRGPTPDEIAEAKAKARQDYATWWEALRSLTHQLRGRDVFERWRIDGIGAIRDPWEKGY